MRSMLNSMDIKQKLVLFVTLAYVISPIDAMPGIILDDAIVSMLGFLVNGKLKSEG